MSAQYESLSGAHDVPFPEWEGEPPPGPSELLAGWLDEAVERGCAEPRGAAVSTVDEGFRLSSRMMTMVGATTRGLVFATHTTSRKAHDIRATKSGSALFYWREIGRQLLVAGTFEPVDGRTSESLWHGRHPALHPMSSSSRQSELLADPAELRDRVRLLEAGAARRPAPMARPDRYVGYELRGTHVEFWSSASDRLHRRLQYTWSGEQWCVRRLQP
ncbi:pyridoxamine 5'-phosphate oxidase [Kitasatospora sp. SolWspMP-SS2h]|uniref:pyridoxal 5'-phosphate synthase n=1 Tax=Kitasatospora sp. SolWspMP-SS2h TaxID=1305729 RepID=UPI000DC04F45|nr:pyridoxal 5'-phosphate synthase [Kitasatospora sp. SolWspMP-SS2h]RAJ43062.1 pyridoxamine 5'-phosphate oxidase [Kitasatospora sp. SolWspMP-SS2h]